MTKSRARIGQNTKMALILEINGTFCILNRFHKCYFRLSRFYPGLLVFIFCDPMGKSATILISYGIFW